jgi:serine/threonine protein kinase
MVKKKNKITIIYPTKKHKINGWLAETEISIGRGLYGNVFKVCKEKNCDFVMKVIYNYDINSVRREICIQGICSKYNLCKPVADSWLIQNGGVIISSVMEQTLLGKLTEVNTDNFKTVNYRIKKLVELFKNSWILIFKLHKLGIYHGDCHTSNIMLDENDNLYFIDMGKSGFFLELSGKKTTETYKNNMMNKNIADYSNSVDFYTETDPTHISNILFDKIQIHLDKGENYYEAEKKTINEMLNMDYIVFYNMLLENKIV